MNDSSEISIGSIPGEFCRELEFFFFDIDDTFTKGGLIPPDSYSILWELFHSGLRIVPVTGRPAGWCDHIARMWPVEGIIGENGAFYFVYDRERRRMKREFLLTEAERRDGVKGLKRIRKRVLQEVPGSSVAADQSYRCVDLAIDYCEDTGPLDPGDVERICSIMREEGANYKVSSIHVNCWYGDFNKVSCIMFFLENHAGLSPEALKNRILFIGDSPNDEPMFKELGYSIAVANIKKFLPDLDYPPRYITKGEASDGFCEAVRIILEKRAGSNIDDRNSKYESS